MVGAVAPNPQQENEEHCTSRAYEHGDIENPLAGCDGGKLYESLPAFLDRYSLDEQDVLPLGLLQRAAYLIKVPLAYQRPPQSPQRSPQRLLPLLSTYELSDMNSPPNATASGANGLGADRASPVERDAGFGTRRGANSATSTIAYTTDSDSTAPTTVLNFGWQDYQKEQPALKRETEGSIKTLTKDMIVILVTCAFGAVLQGWAQENIVGANLKWPIDLKIARGNETGDSDAKLLYDVFKLNETELQDNTSQPDTGLLYFSLVNSIPYFTAGLFGLLFDPLSYFHGRRGALLVAAILSIIGPLGASCSTNWHMLLAFRTVQGMGMGAKAATVPVLESEVVAPEMRGKLMVLWQTFVAVGILLGAVVNYIFRDNWRAQLGLACVPAFHLLCLCYIIPESPRWLIKKRDYREAYRVLKGLRETPLQAARDLYLIHIQQRVEMKLLQHEHITDDFILQTCQTSASLTVDESLKFRHFFKRLLEIFTIRRNLRAVIGACSAMIAQQFCGINVFVFLTTTILRGGEETLLWKIGFAAMMAIFSASAYGLIGWLGRRCVMLLSLSFMFVLLLVAGYYLDKVDAGERNLAGPLIPIFIFMAVYSPGAGAIPFMYSSEVFGQAHREAGMSVAVFVNLVLGGALAMAVPLYEHRLEDKNLMLLGIFAGLDAFAIVLVWIFMRTDSEAATLEDMNFVFDPDTKDYMSYYASEVFPYYFFKCISLGMYERGRQRDEEPKGQLNTDRKSFGEWNKMRHWPTRVQRTGRS